MSIDDPAHSAPNIDSKVPRIPTHSEVEADPDILRTFNAAVVEEFRSNSGRVGGPFADSEVVLLTMTGAKSGERRLTPLEYFTIDGRILIVGTRGGAPQNPAWAHNLRRNPAAHVEIGTQSYDVEAQEITGDERDVLFAKMIELCPRIATYPKPERVIPLFELHRVWGRTWAASLASLGSTESKRRERMSRALENLSLTDLGLRVSRGVLPDRSPPKTG